MKPKIWYRTEIGTTYDQFVEIQPGANGESVEIRFKDNHNQEYYQSLRLDESTLEAVIAKLREMMEHVKNQ